MLLHVPWRYLSRLKFDLRQTSIHRAKSVLDPAWRYLFLNVCYQLREVSKFVKDKLSKAWLEKGAMACKKAKGPF